MRTVTAAAPMYHGFAVRRRQRSLFLSIVTQQVRSLGLLRELARVALALAAAGAWATLVLLLAGA